MSGTTIALSWEGQEQPSTSPSTSGLEGGQNIGCRNTVQASVLSRTAAGPRYA
jgi:hypothetical protein